MHFVGYMCAHAHILSAIDISRHTQPFIHAFIHMQVHNEYYSSDVAFYSGKMNLNVNVVRQAGITPKLFAALVWNEVYACVLCGWCWWYSCCCSCGCEITVSMHNNTF